MERRRKLKLGRRALALGAVSVIALGLLAGGAMAQSGDSDVRRGTTFIGVYPGLMTNLDPAVYQGRPFEVQTAWTSAFLRPARAAAGARVLPGPFAWRPFVATAWKRDARGNWTFTLRQNVKAPTGNVMTTDDVVWSFQRIVATDAIARFLFTVGNVDQRNPITVINSRTVRLNVTAPSYLTIGAIHYPMLTIYDSVELKKHATASDPWAKDWLVNHSATFAPYYVTGFQPGTTITLAANPNHWAPLYFKNLVLRSVPDSSSRLQIMVRGQADRTTYLDLGHFNEARRSPNVTAVPGLSSEMDMLFVNHALKPFSDKRVRQAVAFALDRNAILRSIYRGIGKPAYYQITSALQRPPGAKETRLAYNPTRARQLLAQAGYANGFEFTASANVALSGGGAQEELTLLQAQLARVGIRMKIEMMASSTEFEAARNQKKLEAWLFVSRPAIQDLNYDVQLKYTTNTTTNRFNYSNPEVDRLTRAINNTPPGPRANRSIARLLRILDEETPAIPIVETVNQLIWARNITGYNTHPAGFLYPDELRRQ